MMKIEIKILYVVIAILSLTSCNDFLDIKPKGELIPRTADDYEAMLNHSQLLKASETYPIFLTDDVLLLKEPVGFLPNLTSKTQSTKNLYKFDSEVFGESEDDGLWVYSYNRIYYYNVVAKNILNVPEVTEERKNTLRAEALVGRAFEYLTLVNAYAKHYDLNTADTDLGVPLILDEDINVTNLTRATVQEVYNQIQKDLNEAEKYLPEKPISNAFRASKAVGLGMLARMHLYMGHYQEALKYANKSLETNGYLLDLKQYKVVNPYAAIGRINVPDMSDNPENIYIRLAPYVFGASFSTLVSDDLLNLFDKEKDKRFLLYSTNTPFGQSFDYYLWLPFLSVNMAMTTPEMYLIAAECEARIGSTEKAMQLLNKLRDNRIIDNVPLVANSNEDALIQVLNERRREFALTGCMRLIDLKRLNKEPKLAKTVEHKVGDEVYKLEPNDAKYILPIPAKVLRFNPNMKGNIR